MNHKESSKNKCVILFELALVAPGDGIDGGALEPGTELLNKRIKCRNLANKTKNN